MITNLFKITRKNEREERDTHASASVIILESFEIIRDATSNLEFR